MIYIWLNIVPILVATAIGLALGIVALVLSRAGHRMTPLNIAVVTLCLFWENAILAGALILAPPKADAWTMALGSAFIIWIGFVAPAIIVSGRGAGASWQKVGAHAGYWFVAMMAGAAAMMAMGLVPPPPGA